MADARPNISDYSRNWPHWGHLKPAPRSAALVTPGDMPRVFPRFDPPNYVDDFDADDSGARAHVITTAPA